MERDAMDQRRAWDLEYKRKGALWRGIRRSELEIPDGSRVLELGCGNGKVLASMIGDGLVVTALDFSQEAVRVCNLNRGEEVRLLVADALFLPFRPRAFDVVIAHHLLEHIPESRRARAVEEMEKVLGPGGRVMVSVLSSEDMRFGKGREVEKNTFLRGGSIPTHYFSIEEVRELFERFRESELREDVEETLYSGEKVRRANIEGIFILDN